MPLDRYTKYPVITADDAQLDQIMRLPVIPPDAPEQTFLHRLPAFAYRGYAGATPPVRDLLELVLAGDPPYVCGVTRFLALLADCGAPSSVLRRPAVG